MRTELKQNQDTSSVLFVVILQTICTVINEVASRTLDPDIHIQYMETESDLNHPSSTLYSCILHDH